MVARSPASVPFGGKTTRRLLELGVLVAGAAVGYMTHLNPTYAVAGALTLAIVIAIALSVDVLPVFLVTTIFVEPLAAGPGLRIGRLAAVLALAVVLTYLLAGGRTRLRPNALLVLAGACGAWIMVSFYWAEDESLVIKTGGQYALAFAYMLAFAVVVRTPRQLKTILTAMVVGSVVFGLFSFAVSTGSLGEQRVTGLHGDPNFFALYQLVVLPAILVLVAIDSRIEWRPLFYAVIGFITASVVLSQSRMGLLLMIGVVVVTLLLPARFFFALATQKLAYLGSLLLIGSLVALSAPAGVLNRASTILTAVNPRGDQGSGRVELWRAAWNAFEENSLLGLGAGNFYGEALDFLQQTPGVRGSFIAYSAQFQGRPAHSIYLDALADLGIVGFAIIVLVIGLAGRYLFLAYRRAQAANDLELERIAVALLLMLTATAVAGIFLSIGLGKLLWILVGLALALDAMTKRLAPTPAARPPPDAPTLLEPEPPPPAGPFPTTVSIQQGSPGPPGRLRGL
jgi:putative inorganic carbon (HCO3(-)) transporter